MRRFSSRINRHAVTLITSATINDTTVSPKRRVSIFIPASAYALGFGETVRARLDNGERLPRIPPRRLGLRLQYHDARLVAGVEAVRYDRQARTAPFETPTGGYTLLGFDVAWTLSTGADRSVDVFLEGTNLLDEEARRHTSIVKDLAPLPGRNVTVGARVSFRRAPIAATVR